MTNQRSGQVVTFYSFKGGTGRTMALANVAWILAAAGHRVLAIDWDLESPGLHRYFAPFTRQREIQANRGVIGLIRDFQIAKARQHRGGLAPDLEEATRLYDRVIALDWSFPGRGRLDVLPAGRLNTDYATTLTGINWDDFYEKQDGGRFFDALGDVMRTEYDYTLIDSRTGYSDVAEICTIQLPDVLVDCFTLNEQGIEGAVTVAKLVEEHQREIRILPVPMRLDPAEKARADAGRAAARQRFGNIPAVATRAELDRYWARIQVPYQAFYNYEEQLATFADTPGTSGTMLSAYELLTAEITQGRVTELPELDPGLRRQVNARFERRMLVAETDVCLRYDPEDRVWAEWLTHLLIKSEV
jgi:hypothetical protein